MPDNPRYTVYKNKFIIVKSSLDKENFDTLVFCVRDIEKIIFENIDSYAFQRCKNLRAVEIPEDSKLRKIGKYAFAESPIINFLIPKNLIELGKGWCYLSENLTKISILPSNIYYAFLDNTFIISKSSIYQENYDTLVFCVRDVETAIIPSFIEIVGPYAFDSCRQLREVKISSDTKLQEIQKYAFNYCNQLQKIEFPPNSNICIIDERAFATTQIKNISISSHLTKIGDGAFYCCDLIETIGIPKNSELNTIENEAFFGSSIESLVISSKLINLEEGWCSQVKQN